MENKSFLHVGDLLVEENGVSGLIVSEEMWGVKVKWTGWREKLNYNYRDVYVKISEGSWAHYPVKEK